MEDYVYILDFVLKGVSGRDHSPISFGIGENEFTLLGLSPKRDVTLTNGERIYVGKDKDKRKKIEKVKGRVNYEDLTAAAHGELPYIISDIVKKQEARFIKFFNECPAITARYHALELLPGLGKKTLQKIVSPGRLNRIYDRVISYQNNKQELQRQQYVLDIIQEYIREIDVYLQE